MARLQDLTIYAMDYADIFGENFTHCEVELDERSNQILISRNVKSNHIRRVVVEFKYDVITVRTVNIFAGAIDSEIAKQYFDEDTDVLDLYDDVLALI